MNRRPVDDIDGEDESFIRRWSRRKQEANEEPLAPAEESGEDLPEPPDEPVLTDQDMPDVETLDGDSDVSQFFSSGVSEALRKRALRKMFLSAAFNVRDGLDDYDDDFTSFEKLGDIVTADMRHQMEMEEMRRRQLAENLAAEEENPAPAEDIEAQEQASEADLEDEPGLAEQSEAGVENESLDDESPDEHTETTTT